MKRIATLTALTAFAALTAGQASALEIAGPNAGFELGNLTGYTTFGESAEAIITIETTSPHSGANNIKLERTALSGGGALGLKLNVGDGIVSGNDPVTVSFWARGSAAAGGVHFAELFSEVDPSGTSKTEILGNAPLFPASATTWQQYSFNTTLGPDVSNGLTLQFVAVTGADPGSTSTLEIDDISITAVPEPSSLALLGLGGLAAFRRRRRA